MAFWDSFAMSAFACSLGNQFSGGIQLRTGSIKCKQCAALSFQKMKCSMTMPNEEQHHEKMLSRIEADKR